MKKLLLSLTISMLGFTASQASQLAAGDTINITGSLDFTDTLIDFKSASAEEDSTTGTFFQKYVDGTETVTAINDINLTTISEGSYTIPGNPFLNIPDITIDYTTYAGQLTANPFLRFSDGVVFNLSNADDTFDVIRTDTGTETIYTFNPFVGSFVGSGLGTNSAEGTFTAQTTVNNSNKSFSMTIEVVSANSTSVSDESSTVALLGFGLIILGAVARRKK